jgi:hypothetical protein
MRICTNFCPPQHTEYRELGRREWDHRVEPQCREWCVDGRALSSYWRQHGDAGLAATVRALAGTRATILPVYLTRREIAVLAMIKHGQPWQQHQRHENRRTAAVRAIAAAQKESGRCAQAACLVALLIMSGVTTECPPSGIRECGKVLAVLWSQSLSANTLGPEERRSALHLGYLGALVCGVAVVHCLCSAPALVYAGWCIAWHAMRWLIRASPPKIKGTGWYRYPLGGIHDHWLLGLPLLALAAMLQLALARYLSSEIALLQVWLAESPPVIVLPAVTLVLCAVHRVSSMTLGQTMLLGCCLPYSWVPGLGSTRTSEQLLLDLHENILQHIETADMALEHVSPAGADAAADICARLRTVAQRHVDTYGTPAWLPSRGSRGTIFFFLPLDATFLYRQYPRVQSECLQLAAQFIQSVPDDSNLTMAVLSSWFGVTTASGFNAQLWRDEMFMEITTRSLMGQDARMMRPCTLDTGAAWLGNTSLRNLLVAPKATDETYLHERVQCSGDGAGRRMLTVLHAMHSTLRTQQSPALQTAGCQLLAGLHAQLSVGDVGAGFYKLNGYRPEGDEAPLSGEYGPDVVDGRPVHPVDAARLSGLLLSTVQTHLLEFGRDYIDDWRWFGQDVGSGGLDVFRAALQHHEGDAALQESCQLARAYFVYQQTLAFWWTKLATWAKLMFCYVVH